jgi:hypothetical protein
MDGFRDQYMQNNRTHSHLRHRSESLEMEIMPIYMIIDTQNINGASRVRGLHDSRAKDPMQGLWSAWQPSSEASIVEGIGNVPVKMVSRRLSP